jgi:peptide/nickel transport system substrate-binding protein
VLYSLCAVGAASVLTLAACSSKPPAPTTPGSLADCATDPVNCNSGTTTPGGTVTYTIEKKITGWNLNDARSNTFDFAEVLEAVLPVGPFNVTPDFKVVTYDDMVSSVTQTSTSPQTIVYKIKPEAKWDDGTPIDAEDFIYAWKTQNGVDCPAPALDDNGDPVAGSVGCYQAGTQGYDQMKSVTGSDNGKTVTVVYDTPFADWKLPFGSLYPAHVAKQHGDLNTPAGLAAAWEYFNNTVPNYSGGPYKISDYVKDQSVTLVPNPNWYGAVKPSLEKLIYRIITDQTAEVPALQNGEVNAIYPQPNSDIVDQVKQISGVSYTLGSGLTWEHIDLNEKNPLLADKALRQAIFAAINRQDIIDKTVGLFTPGMKPLGSHNFVPGQDGYQDLVTSTGQGSGDLDKAKKYLTDAGYTGVGTALKTPSGQAVTLRFRYTEGNVLRGQTAQLVQNYLKGLGITVNIEPTSSLGGTLAAGDFDLIVFAWVGTPFPYAGGIQLWKSDSGSNYCHFTNAQSDDLLAKAAQEPDSSKANDYLNQSDTLLVADNCVLPLFQKPTFLAATNNVANIRNNSTSVGPPYNVEQWGIRAS